MRRTVAPLAALLVMAACGGQDTSEAPAIAAEPGPPPLTAEQQTLATQVREASLKYQDVAAAEKDGYMRDPSNMCVTAAMVGLPAEQGAMGVHYFRPDLLGIANPQPPVAGGDGVIDVNLPEVLVYEPEADGSMQLVAAEYLVFQDAWTKAGNTAPPTLAGRAFAAMADDPATPMDEAHGFTPHHELHVWVHRDNPQGLFAEFNPKVTCPAAAAAKPM